MIVSEIPDWQWGDPPPVVRGGAVSGIDWHAVAAVAQTQPGVWGSLPVDNPRQASQLAYHVKIGRIRALKRGFEVTSRLGRVYVRYVGGAR